MDPLCFIVNPVAGGNSCLAKFAALEAVLRQRDIPYTALYSEYAGHAALLTRQALQGSCCCVVAAGGDGTVREVAAELLHTAMPLGILPLGTGNDFIRALGIPPQAEQALDLLLEGNSRVIDAATANGQLYLNVAGFGFDVNVLQKTAHYKPRFRGILPYLMGLLHALFDLRSLRVSGRSEEKTFPEQDVLLVAVGNGTHIGGGMRVTPHADPSDGLLDVCIVEKVNRFKVLRCLTRFVKGSHVNLSITHYFKAATFTVDSVPAAQVQLDGEIIQQTPVVFQVLPGALLVLSGALPEA